MKRTYSLEEFGVKKHETTLKNGLRVIFIEKPYSPIYGKIIMGAGTVFNPSDNGLAHITEHILMNGSKDKSIEEFYGIMESIGAFRNAFTSREWMSVNAEVAEVGQLSEMSRFFSEALESVYVTEDSLQKEKEIIFSEIQKARSNPHYDSGAELRKMLTQNSSWGYSVLGTAEGMNTVTITDIESFFSTYCVVENSTLVIAGGCTLADIEYHFSNIKFQRGKKAILPPSPERIAPNQRFFFRKDHPETSVMVGFDGPTPGSRESHIINFVMSFAHNGITSQFYKNIRTNRGLAYSIYDISFSFSAIKYIGTEVGVPTKKVNDAINAILESYAKLLSNGISEKEIEEKIATMWFSAKRNHERVVDWVGDFDDCLFEDQKPSVVGDFPDIYNFRQTITPEEVKSVLQKYIQLDKFHLCVFGKEPGKKYF